VPLDLTSASLVSKVASAVDRLGGNDLKTYGWTAAFLAAAAANLSFARWELTIARSESEPA
jgi:hypothetical protein